MIRRLCAVVAASALVAACHDQFRFDEQRAAEAGVTPEPTVCSTDGDCRLATLRCETSTGACVECLADADCGDAGRRCDDHRCVECLADADCGSPTRACRTHRCVPTCYEEHDCPATYPACDEVHHICIRCFANQDCASSDDGAFCDRSSGTCVQCATSDQCPSSAPHCDATSGRCVQCTTSAECSQGTLCDPSTHTCT